MTAFFQSSHGMAVRPTWWLGVQYCLMGLCFLVFGPAALAADATGEWHGQYRCSDNATTFSLSIRESGSAGSRKRQGIEAEFSFAVQDGPYAGASGRYLMRGDYRPGQRAVHLRPYRILDLPDGFRAVPFTGTLSEDAEQIQGRISAPGCDTFALQRGGGPDATAGTSADDTAAPAKPPSVAAVPVAAPLPPPTQPKPIKNLRDISPQGDTCRSINEWAGRVDYEYAGWTGKQDPYAGDVIDTTVSALFSDAHFTPVFGLPYTDLDRANAIAAADIVHRCLSVGLRQKGDRVIRRTVAIRRVMNPDNRRLAEFIEKARKAQAWRDQTLDSARTAADGYPRYQQALSITLGLAMYGADLWPSERAALLQEAEAIRRRHADAALVYQVDELLQKPDTLSSVHDLSATLPADALIWKDATPAVAEAQERRVEQRRNDVLSILMAQESRRLDQRGTGLPALHASLLWDEHFQSYATLTAQPPVKAMHEKFLALRNADLAAAGPELIDQFARQADIPALESYAGGFLRRRLDEPLENGRALYAAMEARKQEIHQEAARSFFSPREWALMRSAGQPPLQVPDTYSEPDSEEINLAMMREMTAYGGQMLSGRAVLIGVPPFDIIMPIRLDLKKIEKKSCERDRDIQGYRCTFRHHLTMSFPPVTRNQLLRGAPQIVGELADRYLEAMNSGQAPEVTHTFVLTASGWRSPSMNELDLKATMEEYAKLLSALPKCNRLMRKGNQIWCE